MVALTVQQAGVQLGISDDAVRALIAAGELAAFRVAESKRWLRIDQAAVDEYKRRNAVVETCTSPPAEPSSEGQVTAFYAKTNHLDRLLEQERGDSAAAALALASEKFGRPVDDPHELSKHEMHLILNTLEARVARELATV